jgi:hypothetical protein
MAAWRCTASANATAAEFVRGKIREIVKDPQVARGSLWGRCFARLETSSRGVLPGSFTVPGFSALGVAVAWCFGDGSERSLTERLSRRVAGAQIG